MTNCKELAIIIPFYNGLADTESCIKSINESTIQDYIIIAVNDFSDDNSDELLTNKFPSIVVISTYARVGFGAAVNAGVREALKYKPKYIMLLNNDTIVKDDAISGLLKSGSDDLVLAPTIYKANTKDEIWAYGISLNIYRGGLSPLIKEIPATDSEIIEIESVTGCAVMFPSSLFAKVGYFDERFFLYIEDLDFFYRVKKAGYKYKIVKNSIIWHIGGATSCGIENPYSVYYMTRNRLLFMKNHAKVHHWTIFFVIFLNHIRKRITYFIIKKKYINLKSFLYGIHDFMVGKNGICEHIWKE